MTTETDITKEVMFLHDMLKQCSLSPAEGMEILTCLHVHMWRNHRTEGTSVDDMLAQYAKVFKGQLNRDLDS